jgi:hypothetical protein
MVLAQQQAAKERNLRRGDRACASTRPQMKCCRSADSRLGLTTNFGRLTSRPRRCKLAEGIREMPSFTVESRWTDQTQQGGGNADLARANGQASGLARDASAYYTSMMENGEATGPRLAADGRPFRLADLGDLWDMIDGFANAGARCSAGPCSSTTVQMLDAGNSHLSIGASLELNLQGPRFFNGGGGTFGLNLQLSLGGFGESGLFVYYPGMDKGNGLLFGGGAGFNLAYGRGAWSGAFNNASLALGPMGYSAFSSPGWAMQGAGWAGLSYSLGLWGPPGAAIYQTNYVPLNGQK